MKDSLIRDAIEKQIGGERFADPSAGQTSLALEGIELGKNKITGNRMRQVRYRFANRVLAVAACLVVGLLLAGPIAARDFGRPLARTITAAWSPACADSLATLFLGGK